MAREDHPLQAARLAEEVEQDLTDPLPTRVFSKALPGLAETISSRRDAT